MSSNRVKKYGLFATSGEADAFIAAMETELTLDAKTSGYHSIGRPVSNGFYRVPVELGLDNFTAVTTTYAANIHEDFANLATITYPLDGHVYQRNLPADGMGNIRFEVEYSGSDSGPVEARYNGGAWTQVSDGLAPGTNVFTLSNQSIATNGTVELRQAADSQRTLSVANISIGTVVLQIGQSNNVPGFGTNAQSFSHVSHVCNMFNNGESTGNDFGNWRDANTSKSYHPIYGQYMVDELDMSVGILCLAVGGTDQDEWQKDANVLMTGYGFDTFETNQNLYNRAIRAANITGGVEVLHYYDSTDPVLQVDGGTLTGAEYVTKMTQIANDFYTDLGVKMMLTKTHIIHNVSDVAYDLTEINNAIGTMWSNFGNVLQGADFSDLSAAIAAGGDRLHIKADTPIQAQADRFWELARAHAFANGEAYQSYFANFDAHDASTLLDDDLAAIADLETVERWNTTHDAANKNAVNTAAANAPVYSINGFNGGPCVIFGNATDNNSVIHTFDYMDLSSGVRAFNNNIAGFTWVMAADLIDDGADYLMSFQDGSNFGIQELAIRRDGGGAFTLEGARLAADTPDTESSAAVADGPQVIAVVVDWNAATCKVWRNGSLIINATGFGTGGGNSDAFDSNRGRLGSSAFTSPGNYLKGSIARMMFYQSVVSDVEALRLAREVAVQNNIIY
ncbi:MAG: hypothetical protein KTR14_02005 [Vampirovibrio sp.]|nr:hypothetical protein [Vampirovibrio sp.]